jgi:hypothetical protein
MFGGVVGKLRSSVVSSVLARHTHRSVTVLQAQYQQHQHQQRHVVSASLSPPLDTFVRRHVGADASEVDAMLKAIGDLQSLECLSAKVIPDNIRLADSNFQLATNDSQIRGESDALEQLRAMSLRNKVLCWRPHIRSTTTTIDMPPAFSLSLSLSLSLWL